MNAYHVFLILFFLFFFPACSNQPNIPADIITSKSEEVFFRSRDRNIPIEIYSDLAPVEDKKTLAIISAGYRSSNTEYSYIAKKLAKKGYLVVAIQHELQDDPLLPVGENVYDLRMPFWMEGVRDIFGVVEHLEYLYTNINYDNLHLIGHSNGGDIACVYYDKFPTKVASIITLDHRRAPIPKSNDLRVLSFRSDEFGPDPGVIPREEDLEKFDIEIVAMDGIGHNYLRDNATKEVKDFVSQKIAVFLDEIRD